MVVQLGDTAFQQPTQANLAAQYNGQLASSGDATNMGMFGSGIANPFGSNSGFNPLGMFKSGGNDAVIQQGGAQTQTQVTPDGKGGYTTASNPDAYATAGSVVQQNGITNNNGKLPYFSLDQNAFQNPVGNQAPAWQNAMNNYISNTTGPNVYSGAPSAQNTQLGQAATYNGAQIAAPVSANAAQLNGRQYNQSYNQEQNLAGTYGQMAAGNGPSMAAQTAAQQGQQNIAAAASAAASQRGAGNAGLSMYNNQNQAMQTRQAAAQQAVTGRTQEEMNAMAAQGNVLSSMNSQAQQYANTNAGYQQQANLQNAQNANTMNLNQAQLYQQAGLANQAAQNTFGLQQGTMNQQTAMQNLNAMLTSGQLTAQQYNDQLNILSNQNQQQFTANQQYQQLGLNQQLGIGGINAGVQTQQGQLAQQAVGSGLSAASAIGGAAMMLGSSGAAAGGGGAAAATAASLAPLALA